MTGLSQLVLPILLSAVFVFIVSSVIHMMLPWHKNDYRKVPNEDKVMDALRPMAVPPGDYMMPRADSMQAMRSPEFLEKMKKGPVMMMIVLPNGQMGMGRNLVQWFLFSIVVGILGAYVGGRALPPGSQYLQVFRFVGVTTFCCYAVALWPLSIWFRRSWSITIKATIDGLVYALVTAGTFGWLWPR